MDKPKERYALTLSDIEAAEASLSDTQRMQCKERGFAFLEGQRVGRVILASRNRINSGLYRNLVPKTISDEHTEDLLDHAEELNRQSIQKHEKINAEQKLSDERALQFAELMMANNVPALNVDVEQNTDYMDKGWVILPIKFVKVHDEYSDRVDTQISASGLVLTTEGILYYYNETSDSGNTLVVRQRHHDQDFFAKKENFDLLAGLVIKNGVLSDKTDKNEPFNYAKPPRLPIETE